MRSPAHRPSVVYCDRSSAGISPPPSPSDFRSSHTKTPAGWLVFIPKYRRKALYHELRRHLGEVFRALAEQKECRIEEGHLMADHVHMLLSIPPKYSVAQIVGFIKGKAAIHIARTCMGRRKNYTEHP